MHKVTYSGIIRKIRANYIAKYGGVLAVCVLASACGNKGAKYIPVVDRPGPTFQQDLIECQALAEQRSYFDGDAALAAGIGALAGGLIGVTEGGGEAAAGVLAGGAVGMGADALDSKSEREHIVAKCMAGRGHKVLI